LLLLLGTGVNKAGSSLDGKATAWLLGHGRIRKQGELSLLLLLVEGI